MLDWPSKFPQVLTILTQPSGLNVASGHLITVSAVQAGVNVLRYYWLLRAIKLRSAYKTYGDNWVQCWWLWHCDHCSAACRRWSSGGCPCMLPGLVHHICIASRHHQVLQCRVLSAHRQLQTAAEVWCMQLCITPLHGWCMSPRHQLKCFNA